MLEVEKSKEVELKSFSILDIVPLYCLYFKPVDDRREEIIKKIYTNTMLIRRSIRFDIEEEI